MNVLIKEIKKSICNIFFIIPLAIFIIISIINAILIIFNYCNYNNIMNLNEILNHNTLAPTFSVYNLWIGGKNLNATSKIFFFLILISSGIPYSWSYCSDINKNKLTNSTITFNYKCAKYISIFLSSGLLVAIPLTINLICLALFIPAITPDSVYDIYYNVFSFEFLSEMFYSYPLIYEILYIILFSIFCGLLGCCGHTCSIIFNKPLASVLTPTFLITLIHFINKIFLPCEIDISPISYMNIASSVFRNYKILFIEICILFVITFSISIKNQIINRGKI